MKKTFDLEETLEQIKSGASIDGKDGVLAPLIKQLTEAALEAELETHLSNEIRNRKNGKSGMKLDIGLRICHETIYRYIYYNKFRGGRLYKHLRHKNKKYHNRSNSYQRRGIIIDRVSIDKRPKIVERKNRIGDFEIDTVIGRHHVGALVTVVDRKSKYAIIKKVSSKRAEEVTKALIEILYPLRKITKTITSDNGKEFAYHKEVSEALETDFYFAHPYSSWERGLNEHTNGLIRQYLPKKTDFTQISKEEITTIQDKLNHRPRKILDYRTPYEVFFTEFSKALAA